MTDGPSQPGRADKPAHALWGGRFEGVSDPLFRQFNDSLRFDCALLAQDVEGSIAWARALGRAGVIAPDEVQRLEAGLAMSYEKFVMDVDQLGAFHTLANGMSLDDNGFALGAFREIGPGRHYLGSAHTMANYQTAFYDFELADNNSYEQWHAEGGLDAPRRANRRWKALLESYVAPPLEAATDEALRDYIEQRKAAMPDAIS